MDIDQRFAAAVQQFWAGREAQKKKQEEGGTIDAGTRGAVTGGTHMGALEVLVTDILLEAGLDRLHIHTRTGIELPGYYRPEKKWDLLVVADAQLVVAIEFKSQVGPSFGNNFNNRVEEAIGSATDLQLAFSKGSLGDSTRPFLGYFFLLEDCPATRKPIKGGKPFFASDSAFKDASYIMRYEVLCRRLVLERLYDAACLTLATNEDPTQISHPADELNFRRFVAELQASAYRFLRSRELR